MYYAKWCASRICCGKLTCCQGGDLRNRWWSLGMTFGHRRPLVRIPDSADHFGGICPIIFARLVVTLGLSKPHAVLCRSKFPGSGLPIPPSLCNGPQLLCGRSLPIYSCISKVLKMLLTGRVCHSLPNVVGPNFPFSEIFRYRQPELVADWITLHYALWITGFTTLRPDWLFIDFWTDNHMPMISIGQRGFTVTSTVKNFACAKNRTGNYVRLPWSRCIPQ